VRDFTQMNSLKERFGDDLVILAFPCNQFGHQENTHTGEELLNTLKYVRPGNGFISNIDMMFQKVEVNGANADPLFKFLKTALMYPSDDGVSLMGNHAYVTWSPVLRTDIAWNFEKFLINKQGVPVKRYSKKFETINIASDIQALISQ